MDPDQILWGATYPPYLQTIFFLFSTFSNFYDFVFGFVNMSPYGSKKFPLFIESEANFMINNVVTREYKVINVLVICHKIKMLWHFETFVNTGTYGEIWSVNFFY